MAKNFCFHAIRNEKKHSDNLKELLKGVPLDFSLTYQFCWSNRIVGKKAESLHRHTFQEQGLGHFYTSKEWVDYYVFGFYVKKLAPWQGGVSSVLVSTHYTY